MNWTFLIAYGSLFGLAFIWPITKLDLAIRRKINAHAFLADLLIGALMAYLFIGTQGGMVIAIIATLIFTAYLSWSTWYHGKQPILRRHA